MLQDADQVHIQCVGYVLYRVLVLIGWHCAIKFANCFGIPRKWCPLLSLNYHGGEGATEETFLIDTLEIDMSIFKVSYHDIVHLTKCM